MPNIPIHAGPSCFLAPTFLEWRQRMRWPAFLPLLSEHIRNSLQSPWSLEPLAFCCCFLALSLFDVYDLRLPNSVQQRLASFSSTPKKWNLLRCCCHGLPRKFNRFPLRQPPLVAALSYISQTGESLLGGLALFFLGLGMGVPLIAVGTTGGKLLPKAGRWMHGVKNFFGVMMLGIAVLMMGVFSRPQLHDAVGKPCDRFRGLFRSF